MDDIIDICEKLGWTVYDEPFDVELEIYTPAGEDYSFSISKRDFKSEIEWRAINFNVDKHIKLWIGSLGRNGVPDSIDILIEDARWIQSELERLALAVNVPNFSLDGCCGDCGHIEKLYSVTGKTYYTCELGHTELIKTTDRACVRFLKKQEKEH